jgi:hypothetical protein
MSDEHRDDPIGDPIDDGSDDLVIRRASRELQAPVAFGAGFDARVMAAVRAAAADAAHASDEAVEGRAGTMPPAPPAAARTRDARDARGARRAWAWVVRPRTLTMSPLAGLAIAAGLGAVMVAVAQREDVPARPVATAPAIDTGTARAMTTVGTPVTTVADGAVQQVQFVLVAPAARSVALVGDFNDWNATPLVPVREGGVWTVTVPLAPGKYTYNFVVDGSRMMPDPAAPEAPADDFGSPASIVTVAGARS